MVIEERSGFPVVQLPDGSTRRLNPNASRRHGHKVPKVGDSVVMTLDENNAIIDVDLEGRGGAHRFVTGDLVHVGRMKKEITVRTPEGEKTFPLERLEVKTRPIEEGTSVTVELNEAGTVIDLHLGQRE